jgi:NADH dehydrogenase FAD-containing subunit
VVVVGGSFGGFTVAETLWDQFNVILVDSNDYFQHTPTIIKTPVDKDWIDTALFSFKDAVAHYNNKFSFKHGYLSEVQKNAIVIKKHEGGEEKISFDFLIIATGAKYGSFIREESSSVTLADRKNDLIAFNQKVKNASSILCVGAGVVGIEMMGELVHAYPEKKLGICLRGNRILPVYSHKAHNIVDRFFKERNVALHYNSPYSPTNADLK